MISDKLKCIYIHIPKTGGTSIENKLGHFETLTHNIQDHRTIMELQLLSNRWGSLKKVGYSLKHGKYNRVLPNIKKTLNPEITNLNFNNYYPLCI